MKHKREAQVKQIKRELAQLLESGQDQTARIRVEHVVREEKTVAAYNLLEIYCELIVARMPIIESQKNCPLDLKEAISSVIFASARCEEIPELKDVSKHFTAKYGKEFTSAALELRPNCGVGRMLVEKLSAKSPDGPTKLKILTAIAEEHNIKWDPESFGAKESKIYDDLLNGPKTEATNILTDPPKIQAPAIHYEQRPPSVQVPNYDKGPPNVQDPKHVEPSSGSSPHPKNFNYSNSSANNLMSSGTYPPNSKPQGTENQGMHYRNSYPGNESAFSSPRQHWNMEFKDATAAAQAAAESAERASMAARAAAELSSHGNISQQCSRESHMSSSHGMRDEELQKHTGSASQNEHLARHPVNISLYGRNSGNYEQIDGNEQHNRAGEAENIYSNVASSDKFTHGSFKSTAASYNEKPSLDDQITDAYSQRNSSEGGQMGHFSEASMKINSGENGMQSVNELHDIKNPQNIDHHEVGFEGQSSYSSHSRLDNCANLSWQKSENDQRNSGESRMQFVNELDDTKNSDFADYHEVGERKQSSYSLSHSHSSTFTDDHDVVSNLNRQKSGDKPWEDSFLLNNEGSLQRSTKETTDTLDNASAVFDDYGSDIDEYKFDLKEEHSIHGYSMNFPSPDRRSAIHPFRSTNSWSIEQNVESPEKSISQSHIFSEQQSTPSFLESSSSFAVPSHGDDLPATFDNYGPSSESEEEVVKSMFVRSPDPSIGSHKKNIDFHQAENSIFTPKRAEGTEDTEPSNDYSLEESKELNFRNLTGGLRNKAYMQPPYSKIPQGSALSSGDAANDTSSRIRQASPPRAVGASVSSGSYNQKPFSRKRTDEVNRKLSTRASVAHVDSSDDDSVTHVDCSDDDSKEERRKLTFSSTQDQYNKMPNFEENKRSTVPLSYFGSGNTDPDEDLPKTSLTTRLNAGFSRRTKASPSSSKKSSDLKTTVCPEQKVVSDSGGEKNSFSRSSNADEAVSKTQSQKKNSDQQETFQHPKLASQATSKLVSETKRSSFDGSLKSSEKEQPSVSVPKIALSGSARVLKAQTSIGEGPSKATPSHVHPKLPDYDILTAHLNSIRQNRQ
ncbi:hypothetical protein DITRI_Ditri03aG0056200 [Diplodiscus trichospermus]